MGVRVLIEPLRSYPDGKRAEGIFLAKEFWRSRVPVLLIGLDFRGNEVSKSFYWDLASGVPLDKALTAIISADLPEDEEIQRIEQAFQDLMNPPKNH